MRPARNPISPAVIATAGSNFFIDEPSVDESFVDETFVDETSVDETFIEQ